MTQRDLLFPLKLPLGVQAGNATFVKRIFSNEHSSFRDAPFDIWGGGREFLLLANFFLPPRENKFFWGDQRPTIFIFMFRRRIFLSYVHLLCTLPFGVFSGKHIFHQFRQQTVFNFDNKLFFTLWFKKNYTPTILLFKNIITLGLYYLH